MQDSRNAAVGWCPLRLFHEWAGDDLRRWKKLKDKTLTHSKLGRCRVQDVVQGKGSSVHLRMQVIGSDDARIRTFDLTALPFFFDAESYDDLWDDVSHKSAIEEIRTIRAEREEAVELARLRDQERLAAIEASFQRAKIERLAQKERLLRIIRQSFPAVWSDSDEAGRRIDCILLSWVDSDYGRLQSYGEYGSRDEFERDIAAIAESIGRTEKSEDIQRIVCAAPWKKKPEVRLFAALWYFQDWRLTGNLWSLARCSGHSRRTIPSLALELTDHVRYEIHSYIKSREGAAVLTSRSAAYCDIGKLGDAEVLVKMILAQTPGDFRALRVQGRIQFRYGNYEAGAESFAQANVLDPSRDDNELRSVLDALDVAEREKAVAALVARDPDAFGWLGDSGRRTRRPA